MIQRNPGNDTEFKEGDQVWLDSKHLNFPVETPKFKPKRLGPFKIIKKLSKRVYRLELPFQWTNHPVFNSTLLTPYRETQEHGPNFIKPPPDLINGQEEYEIDAILGHRRRGNTIEYLTKWKGYGSNDNTWEPEKNLLNSEEILEEYKKTHKVEAIKPKSSNSNTLLSPRSRKSLRRSTRLTK
jgi:hypothetical protein